MSWYVLKAPEKLKMPAAGSWRVAAARVLLAGAVIQGASAQTVQSVSAPPSPLTLSSRGSFFVGGEAVEQDFVELGSSRAADRITVNQMYVEFMVPANAQGAPLVLVHGAGLTGKTYDTTPDGRMGWFEYFVRQEHPTYVVDQVARGRSGFNQAIFNAVGAGRRPPSEQPKIVRLADRVGSWTNFRIGPNPDKAYVDTQFPIEAMAEFSRQGVPDLSTAAPSPNPTPAALARLSHNLGGAVLLGHSQSGLFPLRAALTDGSNVRAAIMIEPGFCAAGSFSDNEIGRLARIPTLIVYGDHLDTPTGLSGPGWPARFADCEHLVERLQTAGGKAEMLSLPARGLHGNTHMMMMDRNSLEVADLVLDWLRRVSR
jgi:pimeloyl-ACP methyl ester carboxylesterase